LDASNREPILDGAIQEHILDGAIQVSMKVKKFEGLQHLDNFDITKIRMKNQLAIL
jgi:hypothetical protein